MKKSASGVLNKAGDEPFMKTTACSSIRLPGNRLCFPLANTCEEKQTLAAKSSGARISNQAIQTSNDGIIANDRLGNIIIFNEGAERILGYRDEVIGKIKWLNSILWVAQEIRAK
jgi:PAS domain-containing protein